MSIVLPEIIRPFFIEVRALFTDFSSHNLFHGNYLTTPSLIADTLYVDSKFMVYHYDNTTKINLNMVRKLAYDCQPLEYDVKNPYVTVLLMSSSKLVI